MSKEVRIQFIHRILSFFPGIWVILLWSYVFRVAFSVNHWPYYGDPDTATLETSTHVLAIIYSFPIGIASIVVWSILTPFLRKYLTKKVIVINAIIFLLCVVMSAVQFIFDPGGVIAWFLD